MRIEEYLVCKFINENDSLIHDLSNFKQRCKLAASTLLILTSNKQVATKLNQMPAKESNGATCAWYTMAMVQETKNCFLYTNVDGRLEIMASTSKNLTTHEKCIILGSDLSLIYFLDFALLCFYWREKPFVQIFINIFEPMF